MTKPAISPTLLRTEMRHRFGEISALTPMVEGEESRVFGFRRGSEDFVVRVNASAEGFAKDAFAYRKFASARLPIPEIISIFRLNDGHACCVSRRLPGVTLQDLESHNLPAVVGEVAEVLAAIAASDIAVTSGFGRFDAGGTGEHTSWREFLMSVGDRERYDWEVMRGGVARGRVDRLVERLTSAAESCPEVRQLVHGDFGSNNVLSDRNRITGVIDWSEALIGDPLYDVANILFWRPWLDCMEQQARYFEAKRPERLAFPERLLCYQLRIGLAQIHESVRAGNDGDVSWALDRCEELAMGKLS